MKDKPKQRRSIFFKDSLSPQLFLIAMITELFKEFVKEATNLQSRKKR